MHNDLTFFTNEPERTLYDRFNKVLQFHTQYFDILVGYFRTSGFHLLYPAMKDIEKIRILVGINVDRDTFNLLSTMKIKDEFSETISKEFENSDDSNEIEEGVKKFIDWIKTGKLEMKVYPHDIIHAKVYIMRKSSEADQFGSVITGSSNFTKSGLKNNLEFNVELKDKRDVEFALDSFEALWSASIDITEDYVNTVQNKTWISENITPYELYLKTIYEYFKEEINDDKLIDDIIFLPDGFMSLQYQKDAVTQTKKILDAYNGVFISDVVGLGKTFITAMLAQKLQGGKLVICPPGLVDYWRRTLVLFGVSARVESSGKLDKILMDKELLERTQYVFIDEAHRFRNRNTKSYQTLHEIVFGKKVILISATPLNNYATDIANQIYLFQPRNNSIIIPNFKDLESFFRELDKRLKDHEKGTDEYNKILKHNSEIIRDKVLRNIMIRRTRTEIEKYYKNDLELQGLKFPKVNKPNQIIYEFDSNIEKIFNETIIAIKEFTYSRYRPLTYIKDLPDELSSLIVGQINMSGFMKSLLVKRLESSFYAFKRTLYRFMVSYEKFIKMYDNGTIYISKEFDVYNLIDLEDDSELESILEDERIKSFPIDAFNDNFIKDLNNDLTTLQNLYNKWTEIKNDPKKDKLIQKVKEDKNLQNGKIIIFSESKETAEYVGEYLSKEQGNSVIVYSGDSSLSKKDIIEANYNPDYPGENKDDINILVSTDVLSEGINLHRANIIINYDLPWNPTKIMQRLGRVNRVGSQFDNIYIYNFFPTDQSNNHLSLKDNITTKMQAFHDTLGDDIRYLSDEEDISVHKIYEVMNSDLEDEEEISSNLKYLSEIRDIRDNDEKLFLKIKNIPKKSNSGRNIKNYEFDSNATLTYFKKGELKKFFINNGEDIEEILFEEALELMRTAPGTKRAKRIKEYYKMLEDNRKRFIESTMEEVSMIGKGRTNQYQKELIKYLKAIRNYSKFTDIEKELVSKYIDVFESGIVPNITINEILKEIKKTKMDHMAILKIISNRIPDNYLNSPFNNISNKEDKHEVILSYYFNKEE